MAKWGGIFNAIDDFFDRSGLTTAIQNRIAPTRLGSIVRGGDPVYRGLQPSTVVRQQRGVSPIWWVVAGMGVYFVFIRK